jgi:hypothetical protein
MYFVVAEIDEQFWLVGPYESRAQAGQVRLELNKLEDQVQEAQLKRHRRPSDIGDITWHVTDSPVSFEETKKAILSSLE